MSWIIAVGWVACWAVSYRLMRRAWLFSFDFTERDRWVLGVLSLFGPASALAALGIYLMARPSKRPDRVLMERRP